MMVDTAVVAIAADVVASIVDVVAIVVDVAAIVEMTEEHAVVPMDSQQCWVLQYRWIPTQQLVKGIL